MTKKREYDSIGIVKGLEKNDLATKNLPPHAQEEDLEDDNIINAEVPSSISYLEPLLHPLRDLTENWNVDLCRSLQAYLHDIDNNKTTMAGITISPQRDVPSISSSFNFAQAALVIQGSSLIYSKKVEYFYALVRRFLDRHTRLYAQSGKINTVENDDNPNGSDSLTRDETQIQDDTHMNKAREACLNDERELLKRSMNPGAGQTITTLDNTFTVCEVSNDRSYLSCTNQASDLDQSTDIFLFQSLLKSKSVLEYEGQENLDALDLLHDTLPDAGLPPTDSLFLIPDMDGDNDNDEPKNKDTNGKKKSQHTNKHKRALLKNMLAHLSKLVDSSDNIIGEKFDFFINRTTLDDTGWLLLDQNLSMMMSTPISDPNHVKHTQNSNTPCLEEYTVLDRLDSTPDLTSHNHLENPQELEGHKEIPISSANPECFNNCSEDEGIELADPEINNSAEEGHNTADLSTQPKFESLKLPSDSINVRKCAALRAAKSPNVKLGSSEWDLMDPYEIVATDNALDKNTGQFDYRKVTKKALVRETYFRSRYQQAVSPPIFHITHTAYDTYKQLRAFVSHHQQHPNAADPIHLNFPEFHQYYRDLSSASAHHQTGPSNQTKKERVTSPLNEPTQDPSLAEPCPEQPLSSREGSPASPADQFDAASDTIDFRSPLGVPHFERPDLQHDNNNTFFGLNEDDEFEAGDGTLRARQVMGTRCKDYLERARASALANQDGGSATSYDAWETFIKTRVLTQHPSDFMGPFADASQALHKGRKRQRLLHDKLRYDIIADQESVFAALEDPTNCPETNEVCFDQVVQYSQKSRCEASSSTSIVNQECHLGLPKLIPRLFFACLLLANSGNVDIGHHDDSMTGKFTITLKSLVRNYEKLKEQLDL